MNRKTIAILTAVAVAASALIGCSTANQYMIPGTEQYEAVTANLVGTWTIESLEGKPDTTMGDFKSTLEEYVGPVYTAGRVTFENDVRPGDFEDGIYPAVTFSFDVDEQTLAEKEERWKKDYPDLELEAMRIVVIGVWYVSPKGDVLRIIVDTDADGAAYVEADGSPENDAMTFAGTQSAALALSMEATDAGSEGGLFATAMAVVAETATAEVAGMSDIFPPALNGVFNISVSGASLSLDRSTAVIRAVK